MGRGSEAGPAAAPDLLVFEVLAVLRRGVARGELSESRARGAVEDLGDLAVDLLPTLALSGRAFALRHNLTVADALFVALAGLLEEPLATKDRALAGAAREHTAVEVVVLNEPSDDARADSIRHSPRRDSSRPAPQASASGSSSRV